MCSVLIHQRHLKALIKKAVPALVQLRNPKDADGQLTITGKMPISAAGPNYRWHCDQYEKLWLCGFMIYGIRDRHSGYVVSCLVLRNKRPASVLLTFLNGVYHVRGIPPFEAQFDGGTEAKYCQEWMWKFGGAGRNSVLTGPCKSNQVIELFWNLLHSQCIWIYRAEFAHLQIIWALNINNTIQLSALWAAYACCIQGDIDYQVSTYNAHLSYASMSPLLSLLTLLPRMLTT